jgi:hypothetical protein
VELLFNFTFSMIGCLLAVNLCADGDATGAIYDR